MVCAIPIHHSFLKFAIDIKAKIPTIVHMIRRLYCEKCGQRKPIHPEDARNGWHQRFVTFKATKPENLAITVNETMISVPPLVCDGCNVEIPDGTTAVANTMWQGPEPEQWETEYGYKSDEL